MAEATTEKLVYPTCKHIMPSGRFCKAPREHNKPCCIHHNRERQRQRNLVKAREIKNLSDSKRPEADYRPLDDLNAAIWESLNIPTLDDNEAITIAASNVLRAVGSYHIDPHRAKVMAHLIHIAELNLRKNKAFYHTYDIPGGVTDPDPVKPFGDDHGFVLPEEASAHRAHQHLVRDFGPERAHQLRTELGYNDHMLEPLEEKSGDGGSTGLQASEPGPGKQPASAPAPKDVKESA